MSVDSLQVAVIPFDLGEAMRSASSPSNLALEPGDVLTIFGAKDLAVPHPIPPDLCPPRRRNQEWRIVQGAFCGETLKGLLKRIGRIDAQRIPFRSEVRTPIDQVYPGRELPQMVDEMERQFESNATSILSSAGSAEESKVLQSQVTAQRQWFANLKNFTSRWTPRPRAPGQDGPLY